MVVTVQFLSLVTGRAHQERRASQMLHQQGDEPKNVSRQVRKGLEFNHQAAIGIDEDAPDFYAIDDDGIGLRRSKDSRGCRLVWLRAAQCAVRRFGDVVSGFEFGWCILDLADGWQCVYACAKLFLSTKSVDLEVVDRILAKAVQLQYAYVLRQVAAVGIARSDDDGQREPLKNLFLHSLRELTALKDSSWVSDIWYRKEAKEGVAQLTPAERKEVLENLRFLPLIDYQAEDVLAVIAESEPGEVVDFLCARVYEPDEGAHAAAHEDGDGYEELPYQFYSLHEPLAANAPMVVQRVFDWYSKDQSLFQYRGGQAAAASLPGVP